MAAALLAAWPGSRGVLGSGLAAQVRISPRQLTASQPYRDGDLGAPLATTGAALRPLEAVAASLAPEKPKATVEVQPPVVAVVAEAQTDEVPSAHPSPIPEPPPEAVVAAGAAPADDTVVQDAVGPGQPLPPPPAGPAVAESQPEPAPAGTAADVPALQVTAIGDSVMLAAAGDLEEAIGSIEIDAEVGRPVAAAIDILRARREAGQLGGVVIIHIGNNSPFSTGQFDEMMGLLGGARRVVFVNLKAPRDWEGPNNAVLAAGVSRYPNAVLVDWHAVSIDRPEFFWDGLHLQEEGARAYAQLIAVYAKAP